MYCNSHENWHGHRHGGSWWLLPLIFLGLIILTHGWIIILPLMVLAAFAFFGFALPRIVGFMHEGGWNNGDWNRSWHSSDWRNRDWSAEWDEKRKHMADRWEERQQGRNQWDDRRYDDKPKRSNSDHIDYV